MPTIIPSDMPSDALLLRYTQDGAYTDCYCMDLPRDVRLSDYIASFYTTPLFKIERAILALVARRPATDKDAHELALGRVSRFSAWTVEDRADNQILLRDALGRTRSWLMVAPPASGATGATRLYFGSAVVPKSRSASGEASFGFAFHALSGFHQWYSRALMRAAHARLAAASS